VAADGVGVAAGRQIRWASATHEVTMDDPVLSRRSIRKYTSEPVPDAVVERLLRAAMAAPSAGNQQPWQFVVVRDRATLTAITEVHPYSSMLPEAPVAVVVCGDVASCKWPQMWEQDCAAATENLLVEAELLGLGAVWLGVHPLAERVEGIRVVLGIPGNVVPFAVVPLGHPAETKPPSDRFDSARVHAERW
jgi:nitroreductase